MQAKVTIENITPAVAEEWLGSMVANRKVSDALMLDYAIAIEQENWALNGETIKFDARGRLFDGQHRLRGCILAGKPFKSYVVRGVADERAFSTVDAGKQRTIGDIFGMDGWTGALTASAAATLLFLYRENRIGWNGPIFDRLKKKSQVAAGMTQHIRPRHAVQKEDALRFARDNHEALQAAVKFAISHRSKQHFFGSVLAACYFLFAEKARMQAEQFFTDLAEGTGLEARDPVWVLRERLASLARKKSRTHRWVSMGLTIKAWNKRRSGERVQTLYAHDAEEFPKVT